MAEALTSLLDEAAGATEPAVVSPATIAPGGVDPLGLRQINFDLMDRVLPGLNNVAAHVRPFTVVTWGWRRARELLEGSGQGNIEADELADFVDRIEALFAWSQFLIDPRADLPGAQALRPLLGAESYTFGGPEWQALRDVRRYSTGLIAAVNYGPALRSMYWIGPGEKRGTYKPNPDLDPMLDAFEARFTDFLDHPAFSSFGSVEVQREEARLWGERWRLSDLLEEERASGFDALAGTLAPTGRRVAVRLIQEAVARSTEGPDENFVRHLMASAQSPFADDEDLLNAAEAWRTVQIRQVFRLALEAMLRWLCLQLIDRSATTEVLAREFIARAFDTGTVPESNRAWLESLDASEHNPADYLATLASTLREEQGVPRAIAEALLFCLSTAAAQPDLRERADRLPLWRARKEFDARGSQPPLVWISHLIEVWVIAQHLYWSVGRGLADARGGGKTILRLRLTMEEGGWTLLPGASPGSRPEATPDRLGTAMSLLQECERLR